MSKLITNYGLVMCRSVEPKPDVSLKEWKTWRKAFVGMTGKLTYQESEKRYPGRRWFCFGEDGWCPAELKSYGEPTREGNVVTFQSENSIYTFELLSKE